jgi:hypothetical protein
MKKKVDERNSRATTCYNCNNESISLPTIYMVLYVPVLQAVLYDERNAARSAGVSRFMHPHHIVYAPPLRRVVNPSHRRDSYIIDL